MDRCEAHSTELGVGPWPFADLRCFQPMIHCGHHVNSLRPTKADIESHRDFCAVVFARLV